ncbi:hypothetical protein Tco_0381436 [Tanacetum coccineum]
MHFWPSSMSMVYVLITPIFEYGENATVDQIRRKARWDNDDYVCRGLILNGMSGPLFDTYHNVESSKELWDFLEAKYMAEDASRKKFLVSNLTNYKMIDSRLVMEQYNKLLGIIERFTQHKMNMDEAIQVSCIIDKLPRSWKDFKHTLKHRKEKLTLVELSSHLRFEESLKVQVSDKPKGNNVASPSVINMVEYNNSSSYTDNRGKRNVYVIELNESVSINSIIESMDAIFNENRFSSVPRLRLRIPNRTEDIGSSVVLEEVTKEVVQQPECDIRKKVINDEMDSIMATTLGCWLIYLMVANGFLKENRSGTYQYHKTADCFSINSQSDYSSDGCEANILEWLTGRGGLYEPTSGVWICYKKDKNIANTDKTEHGNGKSGNQGLKLIDQELVMIQRRGMKIEERLMDLEASLIHYK